MKNLSKCIFLILTFLSAFAVTGYSNTLMVTTSEDTDDLVCDSHCSLREAINTASAGDTIVFARELRGTTIQLTKSLLIDKRLTIDGPNKRRVTLQGDGGFRIFHLKVAGTGRVVNLDGLIIKDGNADNGDGGGIYVDPTMGTSLYITNCLILNNTARRGGGIFVYGSGLFQIRNSTIAGNKSTDQDGAAGIDIFRAPTVISNSTISGNHSDSTVSGAGGVRISGTPAYWYITGTTLVYNSSNGKTTFSVGGLVTLSSPGTILNTILAKNTGLNPDFYGHASAAYSLIGINYENSGFINGVNGNIVGSVENPVDPQLNLLTDNGGSILTHSLLNTSSAINAGNNVYSTDSRGDPLQTDQRGFYRIINSTVDMGAFEYNSQPVETFSTITGQVTNANGRGISGARIKLRSATGEERFAIANPFGYYRFINVKTDFNYTIECSSKRQNSFETKTILAEEPLEYLDFNLF